MTRASLLPALLFGATLAAAQSAAAGPLNNRAWWTAALQGMQTQPSTSVAALPTSAPAATAPTAALPAASLLKPGFGKSANVGSDVCLGPIYRAEQKHGIPTHLLRSVALTESGRWDDEAKRTVAWPWTINAEGVGHFFPTKEAAIAAARKFQARGIKSIDVGCMQVNLHWHPNAFSSLEEAFDPETNVAYAANLLADLKTERKGWTEAVGYYHSATPEFNQRYRAKVLKTWNDVQRKPEATQLAAAAAADSGKPGIKGLFQSAATAPVSFASPSWSSAKISNAVSSLGAASAMQRPVAEGRRGMTLEQYRMAPTMPSLDLPKAASLKP
jgi:hypothetical protein